MTSPAEQAQPYAASLSSVSDDSGISLVSKDASTLLSNHSIGDQSFALPSGWQQCTDDFGQAYYWHVPSGRTQRDPPRCVARTAPTRHRISQTSKHIDLAAQDCSLAAAQSADKLRSSCLDSKEATPKRDCDYFDVLPVGSRVLDELTLSDSARLHSWLLETITYFERFPSSWQAIRTRFLAGQSAHENKPPCLLELTNETVLLTSVGGGSRTFHSRPLRLVRLWASADSYFVYITCERDSQADNERLRRPTNICYIVRATGNCDTSRIAEAFRKRSRTLSTLGKRHSEYVTAKPSDLAQCTHSTDDQCVERLVDAHIAELEAEEPVRAVPCFYLGHCSTPCATGIDTLNEAVSRVCESTTLENHLPAYLLVTPSEFRLRRAVDNNGSGKHRFMIDPLSADSLSDGELILRCPLRFLSFFAVAADDVRLCGLVLRKPYGAQSLMTSSMAMHPMSCDLPDSSNASWSASSEQFECHVVYCEPDAGRLCQLLQAACTLRFQMALDAASARKHSGADSTDAQDSDCDRPVNCNDKLHAAEGNSQSSLQNLVTSFSLFKRFSNKPEHR